MAWSVDEALRVAKQIARDARQWHETEPRTRATWTCDACPFQTTSVTEAQGHAVAGAGMHFLWSSPKKQGQRIVSLDGELAVCQERGGR